MKILHAADLHLDSPFRSLPRDKAVLRRSEQRALLLRLTELAAAEGPDLALLAGDLFDSDLPHAETARLLTETLNALRIPVFIAPGNHDPYHPGGLWDTLPLGDNVHVFREETLTRVDLPEHNACVWGCAFGGSYRASPLADFRAPARETPTLQLAVMHADAENAGSPYAPVSPAEIALSGLDYIAMGHLHYASGLRESGRTRYAWPGCAEGRGFDETGEKGVYITELIPDGHGEVHLRADFHVLARRQYRILSVDLTDTEDSYGALCAALPEGTERDIYRLILTGRTAAAPDLPALRAALEDRFFALELTDNTAPPVDLWAGADADTLRGLFLQRLYAQYEAADESRREAILRAARWGLRAMENEEEAPL